MLNETELEKHFSETMLEISRAARKPDLEMVLQLSQKALEIKKLKEQMAAIQHRAATIIKNGSAPQMPTPINLGGLRTFTIEVTEGMIRQNLLTLTPYVKRGKIKIGEELTVESEPSGEKFKTVLLDQGNKLQARGQVARFYQEANVHPGDSVALAEITPGQWKLTKSKINL